MISSPRLCFDAEGLDGLEAAILAEIERAPIPGAVMLIARDGRVVLHKALGLQDPQRCIPMRRDSLFRIQSMTKPIASAAAMMLVEEGRLQLARPVSDYIPALKGLKVGIEKDGALERVAAHRPPSLHDLLRHTAGFTFGFFGQSLVKDLYVKKGVDSYDQDSAQFVKKLATVPLMYQPGTVWEPGQSTNLLGHLIEQVSGQTLDRYFEERIFRPLGMKDTAFFVPPREQPRLAEAFAKDSDPGVAISPLDVRKKPRFLSAGGGLVSTAADYLRFAQMLLNGGELDGTRLLSRESVADMTRDHLAGMPGPAPGYGYGLGVAVRLADGRATRPGNAGEYHWPALCGTHFWVDPAERLVAIWLMQAPSQRFHYRQFFRELVYGARRMR